jgi:hypothetical protein
VAERRTSPIVLGLVASIAMGSAGACGKKEDPDVEDRPKRPPTTATTTAAPPPEVTTQAATPIDPTRPRYLRVNSAGVPVDATRYPSVPESIVEKEARTASTRRDAARLLRRFGVNPNLDRGGEISYLQASLVDGQGRERLLIVSLFGDPDADGMRSESDYIVFLATTDDERLIALGSDSIVTVTPQNAPVLFEGKELHWSGGDDLVASWSSCGAATSTKTCHGMRAWTLARGYPERILDVAGEAPVTIGSEASTPHRVATGLKVLTFDETAYAYK